LPFLVSILLLHSQKDNKRSIKTFNNSESRLIKRNTWQKISRSRLFFVIFLLYLFRYLLLENDHLKCLLINTKKDSYRASGYKENLVKYLLRQGHKMFKRGGVFTTVGVGGVGGFLSRKQRCPEDRPRIKTEANFALSWAFLNLYHLHITNKSVFYIQ
jgi:hypothetical protein